MVLQGKTFHKFESQRENSGALIKDRKYECLRVGSNNQEILIQG